MKKILKWIVLSLLGLVIIVAAAALYFKTKAENLVSRSFTQEVSLIDIPTDSLSLARGQLLSVECQGCHGQDYSGLDFFNDPMIGFMASPNLTPGKGSTTEKYTTEDWLRTLRHGLNPKGRPLMVMPSENIGQLSDQDLGSLIAYLKTIEPIEKPIGPTSFTFMAKAMLGAGMLGNLYPYDIIDHDAVKTISAPEISTSPEFGAYMVRYLGCRTCHGENLNGGKSPDPISPPPSNITPGGNLGKWSLANFISTFRSGTTPEGKFLKPEFMPWVGISVLSDTELEALYNYLKAQPSLTDGNK